MRAVSAYMVSVRDEERARPTAMHKQQQHRLHAYLSLQGERSPHAGGEHTAHGGRDVQGGGPQAGGGTRTGAWGHTA